MSFYQFPIDVPSDCPPTDSTYVGPGWLGYRLAQYNHGGTKIRERSFYTRYANKGLLDQCTDLALSVFLNVNDAREELDKSSRDKKTWHVVAVETPLNVLSTNYGLIVHTPRSGDSHHDWWPHGNLTAQQLIDMCGPVQEE